MMGLSGNHMKSPLDSLFGKPRYQGQEEIPPNIADLIGTLSKMAVQVGGEIGELLYYLLFIVQKGHLCAIKLKKNYIVDHYVRYDSIYSNFIHLEKL